MDEAGDPTFYGKGKIPIVSAFTADEATLPVLKDNAVDVYGVLTWAPNMDNAANKTFVSEYVAAYKGVPASYAMQAYDAAMLINSAVTAVKGNLSDQNAVRTALKKAAFTSVRGPFKFNVNGFPIEDFYLTKVAKRWQEDVSGNIGRAEAKWPTIKNNPQ